MRLRQGDMNAETVYSKDPVKVATQWEAQGAQRLHVVDLNGAVDGTPHHLNEIRTIIASLQIPVEVGGGIRDVQTISAYIEMGVQWVILGTAAIGCPALVREACTRFPHQIIISLDVKGRYVASQGWVEQSTVTPLAVLSELHGCALAAVIFTDISRDGMKTGPNLKTIRELTMTTAFPLIVSGGVSGVDDLRLLQSGAPTIVGVIIGRALYDGTLDLREALGVVDAAMT